ncbi:hypothetical protein V6N11_071557 [Hibiscus sabdariffa]|uniref:Retrotransposon gag domain-containing protein n=1 Tax=Hibiscus sabdariffa TaxID=183260 RepID=A0ABR2U0H6_9ROSI
MFDQLVSNLIQEHPVVQAVAAPSRAPIDKLAQHRAYTFAGTIEEKPGEAEYWLERITQIVTKQLSCSDEHKLECTVALLANVALSWWETTTLTALVENIMWKFFVEEFKKKYINEQYLNDRRNWFLHHKQLNKPIEQYVAEFCMYCKYDAEYIKTEKDKCQKFINGLNDDLGPMFTVMEIEDFQILVNRVTATEAKMKTVERWKSGHQNDKKQKRDDRPQWRHHFASTVRSLTGDNVDYNPIFAMVVVEVVTMSGTIHKMLTKHPHDLMYLQVLVQLARTKVRGKLILQFKEEVKEATLMFRLNWNLDLLLVFTTFLGREDEESPDVIADEYDFGLPFMPVVSEFVDLFPEELPGLPLT